jgi:hypothetical protein
MPDDATTLTPGEPKQANETFPRGVAGKWYVPSVETIGEYRWQVAYLFPDGTFHSVACIDPKSGLLEGWYDTNTHALAAIERWREKQAGKGDR